MQEISARALEQAADAVIVSDAAGMITTWSSAAARLFGFSAGEALGRTLDVIIPERLRKAYWAGFRKAMETGATRHGGAATLTRALHQTADGFAWR